MRRVLDLRITRWPVKLIYVIVLWLAQFPVRILLNAINVDAITASIIESFVLLAGTLLAARIFRGKGEAVAPRRPWWQMTAWPKLSRRLGILMSIGNVLLLVSAILIAPPIVAPTFKPWSKLD